MFAAFDVGVGEFVDHNHRRLAGEDGINVHLFKRRALVFELARRDAVEFTGEFGGGLATVALDHADDDVFAAAGAADGLAEHAIRLAHTGGVAEKQLEDSPRLFR